jgi:integrase
VRGRIESVLDWAGVRGYRTGDNPARWKGHLSEVLPARGQIKKTVHHAAMPYSELPGFMSGLQKSEGVAARALEFAILTAARTGEVIGARWDEISLQDKTWVIPAARMKGGREHRIPLSERAIELLRALPRERDNDFVFIGARAGAGLGTMALVQVLKRMNPEFTVHGFRATFKTWASETTNFPNFVVEQAMAHAIPSAVEASYRRGDLLAKRRQLAEAWSKYCTSPPPPAGAVVVMRRSV